MCEMTILYSINDVLLILNDIVLFIINANIIAMILLL